MHCLAMKAMHVRRRYHRHAVLLCVLGVGCQVGGVHAGCVCIGMTLLQNRLMYVSMYAGDPMRPSHAQTHM